MEICFSLERGAQLALRLIILQWVFNKAAEKGFQRDPPNRQFLVVFGRHRPQGKEPVESRSGQLLSWQDPPRASLVRAFKVYKFKPLVNSHLVDGLLLISER